MNGRIGFATVAMNRTSGPGRTAKMTTKVVIMAFVAKNESDHIHNIASAKAETAPRAGKLKWITRTGFSISSVTSAQTRKKKPKRGKAIPTDKLGVRLVKSLERYKERWKQDDLTELARQLREFADELEAGKKGGKKKAKAD